MNPRNRREIEMSNLATVHEEWEEVSLRDEVHHHDRFHYLDAVRRSWLRRPEPREGRSYINRTYGRLSLCILVTLFCLVGLPLIVTKAIPKHKAEPPVPDKYTVALCKALLFFNTQKSGRLPRNNGVPWRGNSGLEDGMNTTMGGLVGGYYDSGINIKYSNSTSSWQTTAGINIKYHFPQSFAMTMLSWSVVRLPSTFSSVIVSMKGNFKL